MENTPKTNVSEFDDASVRFKQNEGVNRANGVGIRWDDMRFPFDGRRIDLASGRINYDYFNGTVNFHADARFDDEVVSMVAQMQHKWKESSNIRPHFHWLQRSANFPNWLLAYKKYRNGEAANIDTDFSNHTLAIVEGSAFTYSSGIIQQISLFPEIDMSDMDISDTLHFAFFRDTLNTSGLFTGADPSALDEHVIEFDIHYQIDDRGSIQEYIKN